MPRPAFTSKLLLPQRLKQNNSTTSVNSTAASRQGSPKRAMNDVKPGLVLRANVIKVRAVVPPPRNEHPLTDAGQESSCKGQEWHL